MNTTNTQDLVKLARECGASVYTNRHYPTDPAITFGPTAFRRFCAALQPAAGQASEPSAVKYVPVDSSLRDRNHRHPNDDEPRTKPCASVTA